MTPLNMSEIVRLREVVNSESLKTCGVAYSVARTYFPPLCDMAEKYLESRAQSFSSGNRVRYSLTYAKIEGYGISGSDGFKVIVGTDSISQGVCLQLIGRLNAV